MQNERPNTSPPPLPGAASSPVIPPSSPHKNKQRREGIKSILTTVLILLLAPILALSITAFVFQSYEVDGPSMEPTLQTHDRLIVWKVGRTWARITDEPYIPSRGTVVVFVKKGMYDFGSDREKQLIKRIIGMPGERVVVENGAITVFNDEFPNGFDPDQTLGIRHTITGETVGNADITLGSSELFMVGDHRNNSLDSRSFGAVSADDIIGTLSARILPLSNARKF